MLKQIQNTLAGYAASDSPMEMQETAYRLLSRQFLYRTDHGQGEHYDRVIRHQDHFHGVLHLLGLRLVVNQAAEFAGCVHDLETARPVVRTEDAIVLLLLRHIYEDRANTFALRGDFTAAITSLDLEVEMQQAVGRPFATRKEQFRQTMAPFVARGLVRLGEDLPEGDAIEVLIRPAIKEAVNANYVAMLGLYCRKQAETLAASAPDAAEENN